MRFGGDPMTWQYFHFRTIENGLNDVPNRFKTLPVYLTEVNPEVKSDKRLGWEVNNGKWVTECVNYLQKWNAAVGTQPVNGAIFYRWAHDEWRLEDKPLILTQINLEAKKSEIGGSRLEVGEKPSAPRGGSHCEPPRQHHRPIDLARSAA